MWDNGQDLARIGFGAFDVIAGFAVGTAGNAAAPGAAVAAGGVLVAVGADQVHTGLRNLIYGRPPAGQDHALVEAGVFRLTGSQTAAALAPGLFGLTAGAAGAWRGGQGGFGGHRSGLPYQRGGRDERAGVDVGELVPILEGSGRCDAVRGHRYDPVPPPVRRHRLPQPRHTWDAGDPGHGLSRGDAHLRRPVPAAGDGRRPLVGGPVNLLHETAVYAVGRLAAGRLHALPLAPYHAFRYGIGNGDKLQVLFASYLIYRYRNK